jgi:hypothetical protein
VLYPPDAIQAYQSVCLLGRYISRRDTGLIVVHVKRGRRLHKQIHVAGTASRVSRRLMPIFAATDPNEHKTAEGSESKDRVCTKGKLDIPDLVLGLYRVLSVELHNK